jgi:hypothetical protein
MQAAALQGADARPNNGCKDCNKIGLAILPVVAMPVPNALRAASGELKALDAHYVADDLKAHWMVLRTLPMGYLYVFKPDRTWDIYVVDREGLLRLVPSLSACPANAADQKPMSEQCKRSGDNLPAQVIAVDPKKHATVWLAFSRHRWTADVLKDYAANKRGGRDKRMTKLDVMAAANGSLGTGSKAKNAVQFGVPMSAGIGQVVADYAGHDTREAINGQTLELLQQRSDQGSRLAQVMAKISANTAGKTGAVIVLPDDLGVAKALNASRNAVHVERAALLKEYLRYDFVHRAAAGFKKQCEKQGEVQRWNEKYSKAYSQSLLDDKLKERDKKLKAIDQRLGDLAQDWVHWMRRPGLAALFAGDFDQHDFCEGMQAAVAGADCLHGAGAQQVERDLIQAWLQGDVKDEDNILWKALAGNSKSLLERLADTKDLMAPGLDTVKNLWAGMDEFEKSLSPAGAALVLRLRAGSSDPIAAAVAKLLHVLASTVGGTVSALGKVGSCGVMIVALFAGVRAAPMRHNVTLQQAIIDAQAAAHGATATPKGSTVRKFNSVSWRYSLLEATDVLLAKGGATITQTRMVILQVWKKTGWVNVGGAAKVGIPNPMAATPLGASAAVLPPAANVSGLSVWRRFGHVLREGGGNAVMASGVLYFQMQSLDLVNEDLGKAGNGDKALELTAAYFAALVGMAGAVSEITAASIQMTAKIAGVDLAKVAPMLGGRLQLANFVRGAAVVGGVLGSVSGIAMGVSAYFKKNSLQAAGDHDAAKWTTAVAAVGFAGGLTSGIGALVASGGAGSMVGSTLLGVGPAGWALLTAGIVVVGLYVAYQAAEATDDPIEAWLKQCVAGRAPIKFTAESEVGGYNNLFQLSLQVDASDHISMGKHNVAIRIAAPCIDAQSRINYQLEVLDSAGNCNKVVRGLMLGEVSSNIEDPAAGVSMIGGGITLQTLTNRSEQGVVVRLDLVGGYTPAGLRDPVSGTIAKYARRSIKQVRLKVFYLPLSRTEPAWALPGSEGKDFIYTPA